MWGVSGSLCARVYECLASSGLNERRRHSGILVARRAAQDKSRRMINKNVGSRVYIYIYMGWFEKGVVRDIKKNFIRMPRENTSFRVDIRIQRIIQLILIIPKTIFRPLSRSCGVQFEHSRIRGERKSGEIFPKRGRSLLPLRRWSGCTLRNCESSLPVQRRVQLIKRRRSVAH